MTQTQNIKYQLQDFSNIKYNGFDFKLPDETIQMIKELCYEVGSPNYIKTPVFQKREIKDGNILSINHRKKKAVETLNDDDWEVMRNFQTTKIEQKIGIDVQIDLIRSHLNKMTDKNNLEMKNKITEILDKLIKDSIAQEDMMRIGSIIFDIASNNRFYSKIYADLYSDLIDKYETMKLLFENSLNTYLELFNCIEFVDPSVDYDKFCRINKQNENRKSLSTFFVNLMKIGVISKEVVNHLIVNLLGQIYSFISKENKKNEVDELTENVGILFDKEDIQSNNSAVVDGMSIMDVIEKLAHSKSKNYSSLSNKSIFKFMDMIDM